VRRRGGAGVIRRRHLPLNEEGKGLRSQHPVEPGEPPGEGDAVLAHPGHDDRRLAEGAGHPVDVVGAQAYRRRHQVLPSSLERPAPHRTACSLGFIDDGHQLQIGVTERDDLVAGAVPGVASPRHRGEAMPSEQLPPRSLEVGDDEDHMVDFRHPLRLSRAGVARSVLPNHSLLVGESTRRSLVGGGYSPRAMRRTRSREEGGRFLWNLAPGAWRLFSVARLRLELSRRHGA